jgi:histidine ammonia-lyase
MTRRVVLDGESLTIEQVKRVARDGAAVSVSARARKAVSRCSTALRTLVARGERMYGVTTGFGEMANVPVPGELAGELQARLVRSHAAGYGEAQPVEAVRAAILCRANTIAKGLSGTRPEVLHALVELLNRGIAPLVLEKGSLGASGDLAPLSQVALVLIGEGEAYYNGELVPAALALKKAGLEPVEFTFKEGLSLINGSQMMTGELALRCADAENILRNAIVAFAMTLEALGGRRDAFDPRIHEARPFIGQIAFAENMRRLTNGSEIARESPEGIQDAYSLRCLPQILAPSLDALAYVERQTSIELNAAADNPLVFPESKTHIAGGNFHGQAIGMAADILAIALSEVADVSERHTNRLLNARLSGLPQFLVKGKGLNSGLMGAQFTAAALVSENKVFSHPGVVDSISVAADEEDHVSMGPVSVRKLKEIERNVIGVIAVEMMSAAQALDFRKPKRPGFGVRSAYRLLRSAVDHLEDDRPLHTDIGKIATLIHEGTLVRAAERRIGPITLGSYPQ